jgi:TrpR-related protein YerC/YecD
MKKEAWDNKNTDALVETLLSLENAGQAKRFLRDLLTEAELIEFGKRWQAAQMLARGNLYTEIIKKTGLSSRTIARISKWLDTGTGGYRGLLYAKPKHTHTHPSPGAV